MALQLLDVHQKLHALYIHLISNFVFLQCHVVRFCRNFYNLGPNMLVTSAAIESHYALGNSAFFLFLKELFAWNSFTVLILEC